MQTLWMITLSHGDMLGTGRQNEILTKKMIRCNHALYVVCCVPFSYKKL